MNKKTYQEISLARIQTNPLNPRKNFAGPKFEELVVSIGKVGVIEPILLRPLPDESGNYEIVAGERRFRAVSQLAKDNGGLEQKTIPALVQNMTDDEAFELMTIENLQREDLTELEEAQSFKLYLDKKGKEALPELAQRTGIDPRYIRRRITVLQLPVKVLKAWEAGKIKYGHCEQLCRLRDPKKINEYLKEIEDDIRCGEPTTVAELKRSIDHESISLKDAKFNLDAAGCPTCISNSDVQRDLFSESMEGVCCANIKCFIEKQRAWLTANWKKYAKFLKTNGFRFADEIKYNEHNDFDEWVGKPAEKCFECAGFISILGYDGKFRDKQSCTGDKKCFSAVCLAGKATAKQKKGGVKPVAGKGKAVIAGQPRVSWHGEFFREAFYEARIPGAISSLDKKNDSLKIYHLSLLALLIANHGCREYFAGKFMKGFGLDEDGSLVQKAGKRNDEASYHDIPWKDLCARLFVMKGDELNAAHREISGVAIMQRGQIGAFYGGPGITPHDVRNHVAAHIGINLAGEWRLNREYLEKKTTTEILTIINKFNMAKDKKVLAYLQETLNKKAGRFDTCKKQELIKLVLESGADLAGKVPEEILKINAEGE